MSRSKPHIFTHHDLDGAVSLLILLWIYGEENFTWESVSNTNAAIKIESFIQKNPNNPIILLDLGLRENFYPFLNNSNVKVFDHHQTTKNFIEKFDKIQLVYSAETSNSLHLYKSIKKCKDKLSDNQKVLIKLADDFDSYALNYKQSYDLNIIFWHWYQNRFEDFIKDFKNGFKGFTNNQQKAILFIKQRALEVAEKLPLYEGSITFEGSSHQVLATFAEKFSPLIIDYLASKYKPELLFFVNTNTSKVNLRQIKISSLDISKFAEIVCDGGGHHDSAGGHLTESFLELLKNLKQLK